MRNRVSLILLLSLLLSLLLLSCGEDKAPSETYTIGFLNATVNESPIFDGFKEQMTELGYKEGENVTYIVEAPEDINDLPASVQALIDAKVDLIFAYGQTEALAASAITNDIPIVFGPSHTPVEVGLVESVGQPGGNVTGILLPPTDQLRFEVLLEAVPGVKRVLVPYKPDDAISVRMVSDLQEIAAEFEVSIAPYGLLDATVAHQLFDNMPSDIDAVFMGADRWSLEDLPIWVDQAIAQKIPLSIGVGDLVDEGILISYGVRTYPSGKQAATFADKIFRGTAPGDLPVETPEVHLIISLKAADALGIEISDSLLRRANVIIRDEETSE